MMQLGASVNLVVCQKSKIDDWCDHFRNYTYEGIYNLTESNAYEAFIDDLNQDYDLMIGIINYDLLWRRPELLNLDNFTLLLDESSLIQTETAKRSKFILKMQPKNVILLSGTPTGGKYEKLWSQMHLLGWNISKDLYWKQFVNVDYLDTIGRSVPIVTGYKNVDRLKRKMAQYGCQFLKTDEVFDLPVQNIQKVKVPASQAYRQFKKDRILIIDDKELVGDTTLKRMLYERILCGVYSAEKQKAFTDLLESTEDKLIVFYNFNAELYFLEQICDSLGRPHSVISGTEKDLTAYDQNDDSVTFVQYQAGAMGLNLQKACRMIFYTLPLSCELWMQAQKRIHRLGQDRPCFYYIMICTGSIEEKILAALYRGVDFTEELFRKEEDQ